MAAVSKKQRVVSEFQFLLSKETSEEIEQELENYNQISLDTLITATVFNAPYDYYINCILYHVKKKKNAVVKYTNKEKKGNCRIKLFLLNAFGR